MKTHLVSSAFFLATLVCLNADTINWTTGTTGDASGAWSGSATTFNGQSYTAADDLVIDGSATKTVTLSGTITVPLSLTISGTGTLGTTVSSSAGVPGVGAITLTGTSLGGTLNKTGSAELILASANTFGAATLEGGKFFLNNAAGLGTTGTLTVNSGAASGATASYQTGTVPGNGTPDKFFYDSTGNNADYTFSKNIAFGTVASATSYGMAMRGGQTRTTTLSGNISGESNLTLWLDTSGSGDGTSIWRLSGDNSGFAGRIRLNRGRLFLDNADASGTGELFIQSNGGSGTTGGISGGGNGGNLVFGFSGTINNTQVTLNSGGSGANFINTQANDVTITGNITTGSLGVAKMGSGKLTLTNTVNSIGTRPTTIAEGTLSFGGDGRMNSGSYSGTISLFAVNSVLDYASSAAQTLSGIISGDGQITKSGSSALTLSNANTYTGGTIISGGKFFVLNSTALGTGTLAVNAGTATKASFTGTSYSSGLVADTFFFDTVGQSDSLTIANAINFGSPGAATNYAMAMQQGSFTNTLSGNLTGSANINLWLDVSSTATPNPSTWVLSGDNSSFAGNIRLNRGNIQFDKVAALGTGTLFVQTNGSDGVGANKANLIFNFSGAETTATVANALTLRAGSGSVVSLDTVANNVTLSGVFTANSGNTYKAGTGSLILTNAANVVTQNLFISNGTLSIAGSGLLNTGGTFTQNITLTAVTSTFDYSSSANQSLSTGVISGSGRITKSGISTLTLSGNNTFTGGFTAYAGTVRVGTNDTALGTGDVTVTAATTDTSTTVTLATASGGGARVLANNIAITNNGTGTTTLTTDGGFAALTLNGIISGNGNFATTSSGTVILGGVNTYTGTTTVAGTNTLRIVGSGQLGSGSYANTINIGTGTTFDYASSADQILGGVISGAGALTKTTAASTLTLTSTNTHSGITTVSAGTLALASTGTTGTGAVTVQTGGTILGTGLVRGSSFTAQSGSIIHAGNDTAQGSFGTLTFTPATGSGSFDFQSGSSVVLGINPGGTSDLLSINGLSNGTLLFNGSLQVTADSYVPMSAETFDLLDWSNLSTITFASHFSTLSTRFGNEDDATGFDLPDISGSGYMWDISQFITNGTISVVVVPEPGRALLVALGLVGMLMRRRR